MPWVKRNEQGLVRGWAKSQGANYPEFLHQGHQDLEEYEAFLEDQRNPTPDVKADRLLSDAQNRVLFKALFKLENRVRTLEGATLLTEAEYVDIAKASYFEELG